MKKIAAILLILLLFFNWYGYQLAISFMEDHATQRLESSIDKNDYDESQLIEIKVAMNMPYQQRFTDFERHYGEIEIDGKSYSYVKRKIDGDVIIFKCIPNASKQELNSIKIEWTKANNDLTSNNNGKQERQSSLAKNFWSEYDGEQHTNLPAIHSYLIASTNSCFTFYLPEVKSKNPFQPPEC